MAQSKVMQGCCAGTRKPEKRIKMESNLEMFIGIMFSENKMFT
jgi:hypothetical protein